MESIEKSVQRQNDSQNILLATEHNIMEHENKKPHQNQSYEDWKIYMSAKINLLLNKVNNR